MEVQETHDLGDRVLVVTRHHATGRASGVPIDQIRSSDADRERRNRASRGRDAELQRPLGGKPRVRLEWSGRELDRACGAALRQLEPHADLLVRADVLLVGADADPAGGAGDDGMRGG